MYTIRIDNKEMELVLKEKQYKVEFNKIYEFDLAGKVQFGNLPESEVYELFRDGRVASKFLEHHIPKWFPELKFVDQDGYDHIDHLKLATIRWSFFL
jgi:hypothetical protein